MYRGCPCIALYICEHHTSHIGTPGQASHPELAMSIAQSPPSDSASSLPGKAESQHVELARTLTVQPLPEASKAEGGLVLDAEGLDGQSSLRLAPDGHVSLKPFALYKSQIVLTNCGLRLCYFLSRQKIRTIRSTGHGQPNILSCSPSLGERYAPTGPPHQAQRSFFNKPHSGASTRIRPTVLTASTYCSGGLFLVRLDDVQRMLITNHQRHWWSCLGTCKLVLGPCSCAFLDKCTRTRRVYWCRRGTDLRGVLRYASSHRVLSH